MFKTCNGIIEIRQGQIFKPAEVTEIEEAFQRYRTYVSEHAREGVYWPNTSKACYNTPAGMAWWDLLGDRLVLAKDAAELAPLLAPRIVGDELIVLKGSRGVALERLIPDLVARASPMA